MYTIDVAMSLYLITDCSEQATVRAAYRLSNLQKKVGEVQESFYFLDQM